MFLVTACLMAVGATRASYVNFESSHVHPITLTPSSDRLLVVNTPDARLEVFAVGATGDLTPESSVPVGLEPVSVAARSDSEAWVVNHLSDSISIVDLEAGVTVRTLTVGDEPTDVAFAGDRAFVAVSQEDAVKVFDLSGPDVVPISSMPLFASDIRALAVSPDGGKVYAVPLHSGNQTTVVNANVIWGDHDPDLDTNRLAALGEGGLNNITCDGLPPDYPPLPRDVDRNPDLSDPQNPAQPPVSLIVKWDRESGRWLDEAGQDWTHCLPYRLPDHDLLVIDSATLEVSTVDHLGTSLFEVSVNPRNGKVYVPHTDARNFVRFELPEGVRGHMVDNRLAIVDPANGNGVTIVDLNTHIDRDSDPPLNEAERLASVSQPGMMVWNAEGTIAYMTAIGSRKLFRLDGGCLAGSCIFGPDRGAPVAAVVGEGPTGVALHEVSGRAFVLNRFSNSIAIVDVATMTKVPGRSPSLHDPSSETIRSGRRFLYDGIDTSGHGDAACASCHISGDRDELAWDLGDPTGTLAEYGQPGDNVRFSAFGLECPAVLCAAHAGFDPQKGPMTTQTLRGMLEPLHWRGDRPTMNAFNKAFVGLMGTEDIGPINGEPAGLSAEEMELFRQMALGITLPPNPYRLVDDTLPKARISIPGNPFPGNPHQGEIDFNEHGSDGGQTCESCHQHPFGTTGGKLGGIEPDDPPEAAAALFNGTLDGSPHSDLKIPHLRNMHEKFGPKFGTTASPELSRSGFGFIHDGAIPDLGTFLSATAFNLSPTQVEDITMFMLHFPTGIKPSVGRNVTVPAGAPPTGTSSQEDLIANLLALGNLADAVRHCELVASTRSDGRLRTYYLDGGAGAEGLWTTDLAGEPQVTTPELREVEASGPVTFLCATLGSGVRLGGDRDGDAVLNGDDCADGDPTSFGPATEVSDLTANGSAPTLDWTDQAPEAGDGIRYDATGGEIGTLRASGLAEATQCLDGDLQEATYTDPRDDPPPGSGRFYLVGARNGCGASGFGPGRESIEPLDCSTP